MHSTNDPRALHPTNDPRFPAALNPPELLKQVRAKVLRPFCVGGRVLEVGESVTISAADARSLAAIGKCEVV